MMRVILLSLGVASAVSLCAAQSKTSGNAVTEEACSPAISGDHNTTIINCGVGKEQGKEIVHLLNVILQKKIDINLLLEHISEDDKAMLSYGAPTHGELLPGKQPDPALPPNCKFPEGGYTVVLGGNAFWTDRLPFTVLRSRTGDFLTLTKKGEGIAVNATSKGPDGKVVAKITDNHFVLSTNTLDRQVSSDYTSLSVTDVYGREVLTVTFLNPRSIRVTGRFSTIGGETIISENKIAISSSGVLVEDCSQNSGGFYF